MSRVPVWFERKFDFSFPAELYPNLAARLQGIAEPNMGRRLRGLFQEAGFCRVEAFADYISDGTPDRVMAFARDRAAECRDQELRATVTGHGIASAEELTHLAARWEEWGEDPGAFFAFAWCRVLAWP